MLTEIENMSLLSTDEDCEDLDDLNDEQIRNLLSDVQEENATLLAETEMFEKYLSRIMDHYGHSTDSDQQVPWSKKYDQAAHLQKRSKSTGSSLQRSIFLTVDQKYEIALKEINEMTEDIKKYVAGYERAIAVYEARSEETTFSKNDIIKETAEFNKIIVKGEVSIFTNSLSAERCVQYFKERLKTRHAVKDKLMLKGAVLRIKEKKLLNLLRQKEKIGEVLDEVDYNQLKILHQQYRKTLAEKNTDLLRLKMTAGNAVQMLNFYKKKVQTMAKESTQLQSELTSRNELLRRIEAESHNIEMERLQNEKVNKILHRNISKYEAPTVMEYVMKKSEVYNIQQTIKIWERKLFMAEHALENGTRIWQKIKKSMDIAQLLLNREKLTQL